jgi:hypothetical protein
MPGAHLHVLSLWNVLGWREAMPRWSVDIIRKRAEHLGEVDAPDEQAAIKRAAELKGAADAADHPSI